MNHATFFEKFDQLAATPDAVKKMRCLILRLAMQGKLSEPHNADGSVSELLREVEKDKTRLGLESLAATNESADFSEDETTDVIPERWTWVRFGSIARHNAGKTLDKGRNRGALRDYITTSNLYWGFFQLDEVRQMPMLEDELERCTANKGDLLICEGGEAGRAAVWPHDREISFQNHVHRARFFAGINPYFVQRYLEKLNATGEIEKYRKGVGISNMSGKALGSVPVPLPPLGEQKRIVAKVDELMALCDRLDAQQQERETRHATLTRASLARFSDAPTPANLQFLFHPSYAIPPADLRKSILTLAVQGKLVPQDPNTENLAKADFNSLLEIRKSSTLKLTKIEAEEETSTPAMPDSWLSVALGELVSIRTGFAFKSGDYTDKGTFILRVTNINPDGSFDTGNSVFLPASKLDKKMKGFLLEENELLVVMVGGSLGKIGQVTAEILPALLNQNMWRLKPYSDHMDFRFLRLLLSDLNENRLQVTTSTHGHLAMGTYAAANVPFPPLAEQRRIVAKVDQLMALVDVLETQLAASRDKGQKLLEAIVSELTLTS
jgi:type I restriction enzyme S subunit